MSVEDVRAYYAARGDSEWARLDTPEGIIEWTLTCRTLATHLPPAGRVLDLGGGPGRYAEWLASRGHRVVLADLSAELLAAARARLASTALEDIVQVDACDLARFTDASFDAVVALGPFYHLPNAERRDRAARELVRVLRPGGIAVIACMPRTQLLRRVMSRSLESGRLMDDEFVSALLDRGELSNPVRGNFTEGYGFRPEEVAPYFAGHGLSAIELRAAEGISSAIEANVIRLSTTNPAHFERVMELLWRTATEPSILGMCSHLLFVARKFNH
jgi:S-adenosylmethionine-dependent methyltransferase